MEWKPAYKAANGLEAHSLKGMLESEGINVRLSGEALNGAVGELPADQTGVTLWVEEYRLSKAKEYLTRYESQVSVSWHCAGCGEENEGSFEICWQCGQERTETAL
ncbi:DUF2007 domain-containing protein [Parasalinivibrio latis]|uniref:putative signal transducing protein n=1 Tax=Parasalinivibrio latis TaxID=2952610 RepID=UPI0030E59E64